MRVIRITITMFRIWSIWLMVLLCTLVDTQPLLCKEDAHCSEGYYCLTREHVCQPCLLCQDLNRFLPELHTTESCIQSIESCGPCLEGFVNIYGIHAKGKCVSPELLHFEGKPFCIYVWMTAAITGSLVVIVFLYVIKNTTVFRIVPNINNPVTTVSLVNNQASTTSEEPSMKLKQIFQIFKSVNGHR